MRPLLVIILATLIFGGLAGYSRFVASIPAAHSEHDEAPIAEGKFSVELTLSFDAQKDEFAFDDEPALVVRLAGRDLARRDQRAPASEPLQADNVSGIVAGKNAFFVRAVPTQEHIVRPCAVQIRILRDGHLIAENTLWSQPGNIVAGEIVVEVPGIAESASSSKGEAP